MTNENLIDWIFEQDKLYGIDYSSKLGKFGDFKFDIRYDYCGEPTKKPSYGCGLNLTVSFCAKNIKSFSGSSVDILVKESELFIYNFLDKHKLMPCGKH